MCGFAGVVSWDDRYSVDTPVLDAMSAAVAHRGPDDVGRWINHTDTPRADRPQVAMAFRRLAVLDPDPRANQPMHAPDAAQTLVCNGEIYNFRDLRRSLPHVDWRTDGDIETVLHAYRAFDTPFLKQLNGMYALALWDAGRNRLLLARDRMGQKPLYVLRLGRSIAFASELPALRALPWFDGAVDDRALLDYFRYGYTVGGRTIHSSVRKLLPGTFAEHTPDDVRADRYWTENETDADADDTSPTAIRSLVERAVERQLISDVPLGVFLSGGVDSSVIASCARRHGPVQTFSIGFQDKRYDESRYAKRIAEHLGTEHHAFHVTPDAAADLQRLAGVYGEPFADSSALPTHYLSRETRGHVTVALSGDGGDELFGGYDRYVAMDLAGRYAALAEYTPMREKLTALGSRLARGHPKSTLTRVGRFVESLRMENAVRYDRYLRLFDDESIAQIAPGLDRSQEPDVAAMFASLADVPDVVARATATDRAIYLPDDLLTKVDRASMLHALEVRSPFMDHELVERCARLDRDGLIVGGKKRRLREAFAGDLPNWVFKRKKMGFAVPIGPWLRNELKPMLHDLLHAHDSFARSRLAMPAVEKLVEEHQSESRDHSQRLYALLMLELWWRSLRR